LRACRPCPEQDVEKFMANLRAEMGGFAAQITADSAAYKQRRH
jgi:hypothetical protein